MLARRAHRAPLYLRIFSAHSKLKQKGVIRMLICRTGDEAIAVADSVDVWTEKN